MAGKDDASWMRVIFTIVFSPEFPDERKDFPALIGCATEALATGQADAGTRLTGSSPDVAPFFKA